VDFRDSPEEAAFRQEVRASLKKGLWRRAYVSCRRRRRRWRSCAAAKAARPSLQGCRAELSGVDQADILSKQFLTHSSGLALALRQRYLGPR
jgi:hypothetical protein